MFTAQLICQGACRQVDIVRTFGVSKISVIRSVEKYRAGGVNAFFAPRAARSASVMTPEVVMRPIEPWPWMMFTGVLVNQRAPSGPAVMPAGALTTGNGAYFSAL